ncbi:MAG TPA: cell division protein FtsX [Porphyromonadaceae bacterium]|jgi:cell division transport system permease protein|uniref:cell division protein FtsX n=1 Tax=Limibacterium fermenti TaxID=3229863 RepID=UPI000E7E2FAA|nr:cell division protein FtsX [Porphyromonadaceae bacterium]HBK30075.1 cell division protein FtsX [Porphyromonadaceae bacterium]HBL33152.1 cell division protein FtsX [Porphyromonadaceae bacterium]HBX21118.1 cell division protein FtsX [Porphyromonadaceae bacterium]HBX47171.1 cell division protein FtsX [Porphyromonadaceae bacterium]
MSKKKKVSTIRFLNAKITSAVSITMVLVLLGITILILFLGKGLSGFLKENMSFSVMLSNDITDQEITQVRHQIEAQPFVRSSRFISKEEAKAELVKELGDDPEELLGFNPAQDCIEIFLQSEYANNDSIAVINQLIRQNSNVTDLLYQQEALDLINDNLSKAMTVMLILAVILLFISFTLIRNTIRLSVYSKRFLINTMKLVGATNAFIRRPFVTDNMFTGIIAGLLADGIIFALISYFSREYIPMQSIISLFDMMVIFVAVIAFGVLIATTAAAFAVNKYLKMDTNNLYYV